MYVKIDGSVIIGLEEISDTLADPAVWEEGALDFKPFYEVRNSFYTVRWSDEAQRALYYSACEYGEERSYENKQDWMIYEVYEELIYKYLTYMMLEEFIQQNIADSHLSYLD